MTVVEFLRTTVSVYWLVQLHSIIPVVGSGVGIACAIPGRTAGWVSRRPPRPPYQPIRNTSI